MGFTIFESSGTFNPSDYGLKAGDQIHIVAIGGGGSPTNAGGTTSFGSYLSCPGGAAGGALYYGGEGGWHPSCPVNLSPSIPDIVYTDKMLPMNCGGVRTAQIFLSGSSSSLSTTEKYSPIISMYGGGFGDWETTLAVVHKGQKGNYHGIGGEGSTIYKTHNLKTSIVAGGGSGYGAGGGGLKFEDGAVSSNAYYMADKEAKGGSHGVYKTYSLKLSNTNSIAITVGAGGASTKGTAVKSESHGYWISGAGAPGCVAIYW